LGTGASVGAAFSNLKLYDGSGNPIPGAGPVSMTSGAPTFVADFNFGGAGTLTIPQSQGLQVELRGDVTPFVVSSNIENATTSISITATSSVVAFGQSSNSSVVVTGSPTFTTLTTLRSKLNLAGVALGSDSACGGYTGGTAVTTRSRTVTDYVACLKISADPNGGEVHVNTLTLKFTGGALSTAATSSVSLLNSDGSAFGGMTAQTCTPAANACTVNFSVGGSSAVTPGSTKGVVVQIDSSGFFVSQNLAQSLDVTLNTRAGIDWGDGSITGATTSSLPLSPDVSVPLNLAHLTYTN
jgi:hypothetical protein